MDTQNRHLLGVIQVLQQLAAKTSGTNVEEKKRAPTLGAPKTGSFVTDFIVNLNGIPPKNLGAQSTQVLLTLGVIKKYWDVVSLQAVRTTMSKTRLSLMGSIPYKNQ